MPRGGAPQGQIPVAGWCYNELQPIWQSVQVLCTEFIHCDSRDRILPNLETPKEQELLQERPVCGRIHDVRQVCERCHICTGHLLDNKHDMWILEVGKVSKNWVKVMLFY